VQALVELVDQAGARNQFWPSRRDEELCEQDRGGHEWDYIIPFFSKSRFELENECFSDEKEWFTGKSQNAPTYGWG